MAVQSRRVKLIADCLLGVAERFYRRISICGATLRYWRKRVRVERTIDTARRQSPVLKTGRVTGPPSLPHWTGSPTLSNNNTGDEIFSAPPLRGASGYICEGAFRCPSAPFLLSSLMCL